MGIAQTIRITAVLLGGILATSASFAQETGDAEVPSPPALESLQTDWWGYFEGTRAQVEPRVDAFVDSLRARTAELQPQNQVIAQATLGAVRENFS
jgi:hypothetical protein